MTKVSAIIVTNNRLVLLKESIEGVRKQSAPLHKIIVVNNGSTDGTTEWLSTQLDLVVINQENMGGSGGFYTGIKAGVEMGCDWLWVMDDDTISNEQSLQKLIEKIKLINQPIGFIGSKSVWLDGSPHLMNIPAVTPYASKNVPFNILDVEEVLAVDSISFVSLIIHADAVRKVGLPYKEFFIWGDDQEYTKRITEAGYLGFYCFGSTVLHKTPTNYCPDFYRDVPANLWKHAFGFRNEFFMVKKRKGFAFFIVWLLIKLTYTSGKLIFIRRSDRIKFLKTLCKSAWQSIFFNPKINHV